MSGEIYFFISGDDSLNEKALNILSKLKGITIKCVSDTLLLNGLVDLPFIETNDGSRYYGIESIKKYAKCKGKNLQTA